MKFKLLSLLAVVSLGFSGLAGLEGIGVEAHGLGNPGINDGGVTDGYYDWGPYNQCIGAFNWCIRCVQNQDNTGYCEEDTGPGDGNIGPGGDLPYGLDALQRCVDNYNNCMVQ